MASRILADVTASVTDLQKDPTGTAASGNGAAVAILNRNALAFYCVPAGEYLAMVDRLDDIELHVLADARRGGPFVEVGLAEL
ncbi:plasmid stabilization protein [Paracoccaceae bacterium]|nr:plasmid stabilization protein [Paracoccaceae bacterium]